MTEKQAIHCMKFNCELAVCEKCDLYGTVGTDHCFEDACRKAIEALDKQIPKKPIPQDEDCLECPNCDSFIGYASECKDENYQVDYCSNCGQAIKWE